MKKDTLLGIVLNVVFVLSIFTLRYFYVKEEYDFLKLDSVRQEQLINTNEVAIDSLSTITRRLQIDNDTQEQQIKRYSTDLYEIIRWSKEYEQRLQNLIDTKISATGLQIEEDGVPFSNSELGGALRKAIDDATKQLK